MGKNVKKLRSAQWFDMPGKDGFIHRTGMKNRGVPAEDFFGKPVIGICNTWSEITHCNSHFRDLAQYVKNGIHQNGGFPIEFPGMSLAEGTMRPTSMLFRNLASMEVEEFIRANPFDGIVLLCGCDKTTPSLLMAAASVGLPTIVISGGPQLSGNFKGERMGSGTHIWKFTEDLRAGKMTKKEFFEAEGCMTRSFGSCNTMGTASSMACMVESLGMSLPQNATIPAVDARRKELAIRSGRRIVEMVWEDMTIDKIITPKSVANAIKINAAIGGSTNFIIHLMAIARRIGIPLNLEDFEVLSAQVPLLVNLMPSGQYLMEDFYYAGGLPVVIKELANMLENEALTVNGKTLGENNRSAECYNRAVIHTMEKPVQRQASIKVMRGNLCQDGAIIKISAATPALLKHRGRAVVFEGIEDYKARIDDPDLDITENDIMVLKYVGPKGYPGMPEVGNMQLPKKLLKKGVRDMIRISDGRMSGTAFGTIFLHVSPESFIGGALALVENGDYIEVDVEKRKLHLAVSDTVLKKRKQKWTPPQHRYLRGYPKLYINFVEQAHLGADFDFLVGHSGSFVDKESH